MKNKKRIYSKMLKCAALVVCSASFIPATNLQALGATSSEIKNFNEFKSHSYTADSTTIIKNDISLQEGMTKEIKDISNVIIEGSSDGNTPTIDGTDSARSFQYGFLNSRGSVVKNLNFSNLTRLQNGLFRLTRNSNVTFENVTISNIKGGSGNLWGNIDVEGGSTLTIKNSTFTGNETNSTGNVQSMGGVLQVQGLNETAFGSSTVEAIQDSVFSNNSITSDTPNSVLGGAIFVEGKVNRILNSEFRANSVEDTGSANAYGGAISIGGVNTDRGNAVVKVIDDTIFDGNRATANTGTAYGGAIYNKYVLNEIKNSTFTNNTATSTSTVGHGYGGAIYNDGLQVLNNEDTRTVITNSSFTGNSAATQGGAIYTTADIILQNGTRFENNTAAGLKNDIYFANGSNMIVSYDSESGVNKNVYINSGLASATEGSKITIENGAILNLTGNNENFSGSAEINDGKLVFTQSADSTYIGGETVVNENGTFKYVLNTENNNGYHLPKISGDGTFEKAGEGTFYVTDDFSDFTGTLQLDEGTLWYISSKSPDDGNKFFQAARNIINGELIIDNSQGDDITLTNVSSTEAGASIKKMGNGILNITGDSSNYSGGAEVEAGTLQMNDTFFADGSKEDSSNIVLGGNSVLSFNVSDDLTVVGNTAGDLITTSTASNGHIEKNGLGNLTLAGNYSGFSTNNESKITQWDNLKTGIYINQGSLTLQKENEGESVISTGIKIGSGADLFINNNSNEVLELFPNTEINSKTISNGIFGDGTFITDGNVALGGGNYAFTGVTNINSGEVTFEKKDKTSFVNGTVNINDGATLKYINDIASANDILPIKNLVGSGTLIKEGSKILGVHISDVNTSAGSKTFDGTIDINKGTLAVYNHIAQSKNNEFNHIINVNNDASLEYVLDSATSDSFTLNSSSKVGFGDDSSGASIKFQNGSYNLYNTYNNGDNASSNSISFDNANITVGAGKDNVDFKGNYSLVASTLDLSGDKKVQDYTFENLTFQSKDGVNSGLGLNIDLTYDKENNILPKGDTITVTGSSNSGIANISKLYIVGDNGMFPNADSPEKVIQVFKGENNNLKVAVSDNIKILSWATNVYKYGIKSASTVENKVDSIKVLAEGYSSTDTLRDMNRYNRDNDGGNRGFSFILDNGKPTEYHIYRDLNNTTSGNFTVIGTVTSTGEKCVLSGELKEVVTTESSAGDTLVVNPDGTITYGVGAGAHVLGENQFNVEYVQEKDLANNVVSDELVKEYHIPVSTLTPVIKDAQGNSVLDADGNEITQTNGSFFEVVNNNTNLEISNLIIKDAKRYFPSEVVVNEAKGDIMITDNPQKPGTYVDSKPLNTYSDGSVIYANAESNTNITLNSVDFLNNEVLNGNGGAIANIKSTSMIIDGTENGSRFEGNKARLNGGAIYNTSTGLVIKNITADNNIAGNETTTEIVDGKGGAIYTSANATIIDSDFGTKGFNFHRVNGEQVKNDIYIDGENTKLTFEVTENANNKKESSINSGIAGNGTFIKTGKGTLNLSGENSGYNMNIDEGTVKFDGDHFTNGDININNGANLTISDDAKESVVKLGKLSGNGTVDVYHNVKLADKDNSKFTGDLNVDNLATLSFTKTDESKYISGATNIGHKSTLEYSVGTGLTDTLSNVIVKDDRVGYIKKGGSGELTFNETDNDFKGTLELQEGKLNVQGSEDSKFAFNTLLFSNTTLDYSLASGNEKNINGNISFNDFADSAKVNFSGGTYNLISDIKGSTDANSNSVNFSDTTLVANGSEYNSNYIISNSLIDLTKDSNAVSERNFSNLQIGENTTLNVDVKWDLPNAPTVDKLTSGAENSEQIKLGSVIFSSDKDTGIGSTYTLNALGGNLQFADKEMKWGTTAYEYDVQTKNQDIIMTVLKASSENSLKNMNQQAGERGFNFTEADDKPYVIGESLGETATGTFNVLGKGVDTTVISGGESKSFFEVNNATDLTVQNLTLTAANGAAGSVVSANNSEAKIKLENVNVNQNVSEGNGGAINNTSSESFEIANAEFKHNISGGKGGAIYTASDMTIKNSDFSENIQQNGIANDIYIDNKANVKFETSDANHSISSGIAGNGNFTKVGDKELLLSGKNDEFTGTMNIKEGSVKFDFNEENQYISGTTNIEKDAKLVANTLVNTELSKLQGNGTLQKFGANNLVLTGNNSNFTGMLDIQSGELAIAQGSTIGKLTSATFADGTSFNLRNTVAEQKADGTWTTNPDPANLENIYIATIDLRGNVGLKLDMDLKNSNPQTNSDKIGAENVTGGGHFVLNNESLNVVSDSLLKNTKAQISYGALAEGNHIVLDDSAKVVMGPIQKYNVTYANGFLDFNRQGGSAPDIQSVNPAVMASPVATQIGGHLTQLETLHSGFYHMDKYTKYTRKARLAVENANRYAIEEGTPAYASSSIPETSHSMWVRPYTSFENVPLKGGLKVSNITYGTLYGGDSDIHDLGHGFKGVISAFVGYNGSHQNYSGVSMNQQGGTLGLTGSLYKGNFFTGLTISSGASSGEAYTQYGRDNFATITAGVASKTGYNWEIKEGKIIVQPSLFLGYTFVNTFDYRNAAGVRIDSDSLNAIQIIPGLKVIGNLKNGWQPYAGVDMVWNVMGKTNVMANDVRLPQLSVKPYIQYGVGIQKTWGEKFTAFFQTMIRNGGRNGVVLNCGFRWALGKEPVHNPNVNVSEKKVIKQLSK